MMVINQILEQYELNTNYDRAKEDVIPFIKDITKLDVWSADFFKQITDNLLAY